MTIDDFAKLEALITKTVNASVATAIENNVNGKIRSLDKKIVDYIEDSAIWRKGMEYKIDPVSKAFGNADTTINVLVATTKVLAFVGIIILGIIVLSYAVYEAIHSGSIKPLISAFKSFL